MSDDSMVRAIIADTREFQAQYRREQAEQAARVARVGDERSSFDIEEINRLSGTTETRSEHASEVDRLLSVAEQVQPKPVEHNGRELSKDDADYYYGI